MHLRTDILPRNMLKLICFMCLLSVGRPHHWDNYENYRVQRMVDFTNRLGITVLYEHEYLNNNNIAFSPYGLACVVIAVFEGVEGSTAYEIQVGAALPWDMQVVRVGFRELHRTVSSYFETTSECLHGLTFSMQNINFKPSYLERLTQYGLLLNTSTSDDVTTTSTHSPRITPTQFSTTEQSTLSDVPATSTDSAINSNSLKFVSKSTKNTNYNTVQRPIPTQKPIPTQTQMATPTETATQSATPTKRTTTNSDSSATETVSWSETESSRWTEDPSVTGTLGTTESDNPSTIDDQKSIGSFTATDELARTRGQSKNIQFIYMLDFGSNSERRKDAEIVNNISTTTPNSITNEQFPKPTRRKRSLLEFSLPDNGSEEEIEVDSGENYRRATFMVRGTQRTEVDFMMFTGVFNYAYLPQLYLSVLRLPLDDENYYLLLLLPNYGIPISHVTNFLAHGYALRELSGSCRPTYVTAKVPAFLMQGTITLTRDLQNLGIRRMFEPRQDDFRPMTEKSGVFVENIQQEIVVNIMKHTDNTPNTRRQRYSPPVQFLATYPFLYFLMDSKHHVALVAGKVMDPLNSRIL